MANRLNCPRSRTPDEGTPEWVRRMIGDHGMIHTLDFAAVLGISHVTDGGMTTLWRSPDANRDLVLLSVSRLMTELAGEAGIRVNILDYGMTTEGLFLPHQNNGGHTDGG